MQPLVFKDFLRFGQHQLSTTSTEAAITMHASVTITVSEKLLSFMQAGAIFWNGRGDGDARAGLFIEQQQADDIR